MKADKAQMFPVPLESLKPDDAVPFPLFLFLKLNNKYIPVRLPGDPVGKTKYDLFLERKHTEMWVPTNFEAAYKSYLDYLNGTKAPVAPAAPIEAGKTAPAGAQAANNASISSEAELVRDVLEDEELTQEEKSEVLSAVSQDMLRALNQITTRGEAARSEGLKRCKEIADEVLKVAAQSSNIYDEILALRNSQEDFEHSVIVGTISVMFGMALGFSDEKLLADLTVGAIFHDIGLVRVNPEVMAKHESKWSDAERKEYENHVMASVNVLKESGTNFHPRVYRMIAEHHENYDGSGFPMALQGMEIEDVSQVLHLGNLFDRLCTGKQTGIEVAPAEAFDYIYEVAENANAVQEIQPEIVQRVFQFMLNEKESADAMRQAASEKVATALKTA